MPNGSHNHHGPLSTPRVRNGEPQPAPTPASEPATAKRDLKSWWKQFSKGNPKKEDEKGTILFARIFRPVSFGQRRSRLDGVMTGLSLSNMNPQLLLSFESIVADSFRHTQNLRFAASLACPSSLVYHTRTLPFRSSTKAARATYTATCPS